MSRSTDREVRVLPKTERQKLLKTLAENNELAEPFDLMPHLLIQERERIIAYSKFVDLVRELPGVIVEVGVGSGASLMTLASREVVNHPYDLMRAKIFGFDSFSGFPSISQRDGGQNSRLARVVGGYSSNYKNLLKDIEIFDQERPYGNHQLIELIQGDVVRTIPRFVKRFQNGGNQSSSLDIKLLHLDCDLEAPTRAALENFAPLLTPGAIVVLDEWDWGRERFPGEIHAVKEYFGADLPEMRRISFRQPGGWFKVTPELYKVIQNKANQKRLTDEVSIERSLLVNTPTVAESSGEGSTITASEAS